MHINTSHKNSNFSKLESYFIDKISSGFPSDVLRELCLFAAFYLVELQAAYMLLSQTSVNHRAKAEQL